MKTLFKIKSLLCLAITLSLNSNSQTITTIAGTTIAGFSGDGSAAIGAQFNLPGGIALDGSGNIFVSDQNNQRVRKINLAGIISTFAGTTTAGYNGDGAAAIGSQLNTPYQVAVDASGNVYIADFNNHRIRKVNTLGVISTIAGTGVAGFSGDGAAATSAQLNNPVGINIDATGNLYISDYANNRIRKINLAGIISTYAGTATAGFSGDGAAAISAQLNGPHSIAFDAAGNGYIGDQLNNRIRKVNLAGVISTIAGTTTAGFAGDGAAATAAQLNNPNGLVVDAADNIYVADQFNHRVRKINTLGIISTIAGTISAGFSGDNGIPTSAQLDKPVRLAIDATGNMYITDYNNNRIRKITCVQPTLVATSTNSLICSGESATLSVSGTSNYSWNPGGNGASIIVSPTITSSYTVTGTNSLTGCRNSTVFTQNVSPCIGITNLTQQTSVLSIFPNPNNGSFTIKTDIEINLSISNDLGQIVKTIALNENNKYQVSVSDLANGIYFISGTNGLYEVKEKVIIIK